ncbi:MAG: arylesterase [Pseudomonadota bacterium]
MILGSRALHSLITVLALLLFGPAALAQQEPVKLLALGDSLVAGYGLSEADSFTTKLQQALQNEGFNVSVINGGVSGDTSAGGLARMDWLLSDIPDAALIELGANDGLRGLDPRDTEKNIDQIVVNFQERGVPVMLAGMYAPPNLGEEYGRDFDQVFPKIAEQRSVPLYPFFLDGVAAVPELNQPDGIHPNADGVDVIIEKLLPSVVALLQTVESGSATD